MNTTPSILRIALLLGLCAIAMWLILGTETQASTAAWTLHFIIDKTIGLGTCILISRLYRHWAATDPWLRAYHKMCRRAIDYPNPSQL